MTISADKYADRWSKGMAASVTKYREGVDAVTEAPNAKAAAASERYLAGTQEAVASGRFREGNMAVTLEDWKRAAKEKGAARIAGGAAAALPKVARIAGPLLSHISSGQDALRSTPRGTFEENMARAFQFASHMREFRKPV